MTGPDNDAPAGISYHDELHNVSADNHTEKQTTAPVVNGIPQGPGLTESKANAPADPPADNDGTFDPSEHTVAEVKAYLEDAAGTERSRVLDLERNGKARASLL